MKRIGLLDQVLDFSLKFELAMEFWRKLGQDESERERIQERDGEKREGNGDGFAAQGRKEDKVYIIFN